MFIEKDKEFICTKQPLKVQKTRRQYFVGKCLWLTRSGKISKFSLPERINSCFRDNIRLGKGVFGNIKH